GLGDVVARHEVGQRLGQALLRHRHALEQLEGTVRWFSPTTMTDTPGGAPLLRLPGPLGPGRASPNRGPHANSGPRWRCPSIVGLPVLRPAVGATPRTRVPIPPRTGSSTSRRGRGCCRRLPP